MWQSRAQAFGFGRQQIVAQPATATVFRGATARDGGRQISIEAAEAGSGLRL